MYIHMHIHMYIHMYMYMYMYMYIPLKLKSSVCPDLKPAASIRFYLLTRSRGLTQKPYLWPIKSLPFKGIIVTQNNMEPLIG